MSEDIEKNFEKWFNDNTVFFSYGEYFDGGTPPYVSFKTLLHLNNENIKPSTKDTLEFLKTNKSAKELNWGFRAYSQFQDLLGLSVVGNSPVWNRHYCYYESLVYLKESISAWLNQNILAAMVLTRPFLELSISHLYWYLRCEHNDYDSYYLWLNGEKGKTPFKNQLDFVFDKLPSKDLVSSKRLEKTKELLNNAYKSTSAYNHTPKIDETIINLGSETGRKSLFLFFYYIANLNFMLRELTYLYILAYPMSLFPINRLKKWGYGGPVGLFFDFSNFAIIKEYLGLDNLQAIKKNFPKLQEVKDLSSWFEEQPDLSDVEIKNTWQEFISDKPNIPKEKEKGHRMAIFKAQFRSLGWATNYFHEPPKHGDEISDEALDKAVKSVSDW